MQNRYTGDIGDFSKYGLMRAFAKSGLSTALAWYLVPDETHNFDGKHTAYIGREKFRRCDPALHDAMAQLVSTGQRNIRAVEKSKILGADTLFHGDPLDFSHLPPLSGRQGRWQRARVRDRWLLDCVAQTTGRDVVFFDPDNGLETNNPSPLSAKGPKFLYWSDLLPFVDRNQSLVIYNHASRQGSIYEQITKRLAEVKDHIPYGANAVAMLWRSFSVRYYLIIPAPETREVILSACERVISGPWGKKGLFELVKE